MSGKPMKLILTQEVTGLGAPGDVVEVKAGYGRNCLVPRQLAMPWNRGSEKQIELIKRARSAREIRSLDDAKEAAGRLSSLRIRLQTRAGSGGRLFGSISTADIAAAVRNAGGPELDKRKLGVKNRIKTIGSHQVAVRLHPEVRADRVVARGYRSRQGVDRPGYGGCRVGRCWLMQSAVRTHTRTIDGRGRACMPNRRIYWLPWPGPAKLWRDVGRQIPSVDNSPPQGAFLTGQRILYAHPGQNVPAGRGRNSRQSTVLSTTVSPGCAQRPRRVCTACPQACAHDDSTVPATR